MESAETGAEVRIETIRPSADPARMAEVLCLLDAHGLTPDPDIELFVTARGRSGRLIGCLGLAGHVVKCAATAPEAQGSGVTAFMMERLNYEALDRGRTHLFCFTKPEYAETFSSLGFVLLAETADAVLLENTPFGLSSYCAKLRAQRVPGATIGGIVLNANPFTLGHRYLVEKAAAQVDALHVFVVSEDASRFSSATRLRLVREGVAALDAADRIRVHAGSRYIVSMATFPSYFLKKDAARASAAAGLDLQIFRNHIAPALGITERFVGSEPLSPVTASYNDEMRYWLEEAPLRGPRVNVHVIERALCDGLPISASRVRAALDASDRSALARLVPKATYDYLLTLIN